MWSFKIDSPDELIRQRVPMNGRRVIPETMFGVQLVGHGGPEKLIWRDDLSTPQPGAGEALVRVSAAGVNNTDINTRLGWYAKTVTAPTNAASG